MKKFFAFIFLLSFLGNASAQIVKKDTLHFNINKLQVKEGTQRLDYIIKFALKNKNYNIYITAHTDSFGDATKNMKLAEKRANEVKKYFIKKGLKQERITVKSYGETKPLIQTANKNLIAQNRRVEITCKIPAPLAKKKSADTIFKAAKFENDTVIYGPKGTQLVIKARSFYPNKIADVKFGIREVLSRGDLIYGNYTLRDNFGNCLISGGMVFLTATIDGQPVQPNESVLLRIPTTKLDTAMKVYKTNDSIDSPAWELTDIDMKFVDVIGRQYYEFNIPVFDNYNCDHPSLISSVVVPAISAVESAVMFIQKIIGEKGIVVKSKKMKYGRAYITSKEILSVTRAKLISEKKASFRLEENDCIKDEKIYVGIFSKNGQSYYVYKPLADIKYKRFVNRYVLRKSDYIPKTDEEIEAIIAEL